MKKTIALAFAILLIVVSSAVSAEKKISVVTTIFPPYDFSREIAGGKADIAMLLSPGVESHSYEPTPRDIIKIQNCDVFIYVGGESDEWVKKILGSMDTSKKKIVTLMDCVDTVKEELVEGMEDDEHEHAEENFTFADIKDRALSDWAGDWQSVYPYLLDGSLTPVMEHKAEDGEKTAQEYYEQYKTAYATDMGRIVIDDDSMTFYTGGKSAKARYAYRGTAVVTEDDGSLWVRYKFESVGTVNGAPKYVLFSDHLHAPQKTEHFHIYSGNENFDVFMADTNPVNYPTYYPSALTKDEIVAEMIGHGHGHGEEGELDEHVWTSPRNARLIVQKISDTLCSVDAANADTYKKNSAAYQKQLDELDAKFKNVVRNAARKTIVFGDRFPFRYFADAYGLKYYAAFRGCSTETEASAATVKFLIDKINAEKIPVVFHIELSNEKIAMAISETTGAKIRLLHACHNISKADFEAGKNYVSLMTDNVETLKEALR